MSPNVPVKKLLEIVHEELWSDKSLGSRTEWKPEDISKMLEILVETFFKKIGGKINFQRNGLPLGKLISKPMAGTYMHWIEKTYVFDEESRFKKNIVFWKWQMDDIFFVWRGSRDELELFVWTLNGIEHKIQFILEIEKYFFLLFLGLEIMKKDGKVLTKVYRKPTHTQQYINWVFNRPKNMSLGVLKGLIHRVHVLCDRREDLLEELVLRRDVFIANGYPEKLVQKTLHE